MRRDLTAEGEYAALYFSCETAEVAGDDDGRAEQLVLASVRESTAFQELPAELLPPESWPQAAPGTHLHQQRPYSQRPGRHPRPGMIPSTDGGDRRQDRPP